ncbi:DUF998 domain-containing protein [Nocardiopsis halophila]|uniref:DUF998 domain-containing protein n=1 Tax=Nocardiopsis halophila TaxID=141692 RepID=UPI00034D23A4|nr:DUF998 domain-containing protein [Nocardiopsis halophila]
MAVPRGAPTRRLLVGGAAAGPLFVAVFTAAGALRPDYDPLRHPVSSLALTGDGWVQAANFLLAGGLLVLLAAGMRRVPVGGRTGAAPWAVGAAGVGLAGAGVFPGDPLSGYPPGSPDEIVYTPAGVAHDAFSMLVFIGLPVACVVFGVRALRARWWAAAAYSLLSAVAGVVFFVLAGTGFEQAPGLVDLAGLYQRASIVCLLGWTTVAALLLLREERRRAPGEA